jgi:hypothetical protein
VPGACALRSVAPRRRAGSGSPARSDVLPLPHLTNFTLAHGHLVYAAEKLVLGDGFGGAELYATVPTDQERREFFLRDAVILPGSGGPCAGQVLDSQVAVRGARLRDRQQIPLPGGERAILGGGED